MKKLSITTLLLFLITALPVFSQTPTTESVKHKIAYGLVVDNSGSFRRLVEDLYQVSAEVVRNAGDGDRGFLVTFTNEERTRLREPLTDDRIKLLYAIESMYIEGGQTAILEAVRFSANYLIENADKDEQKVLFLITDGEERDKNTKQKTEEVAKILEQYQIRLFVIVMSDQRPSFKLVDELVKRSGGKRFYLKNPKDHEGSVKEMWAEVNLQ